MRRCFSRWGVTWLFGVGCLVGAGGAAGQPLSQQVPNDALFYAGWSGGAGVGDAYAQSTLREVVELVEPARLSEAYRRALPMLQHAVGDPEVGGVIGQVQAVAETSARGGVAVYVTAGGGGPEDWGLGVLWEPADADDRQALLGALKSMLDRVAEPTVQLVTQGAVVGLLVGPVTPPAGAVADPLAEAGQGNAAALAGAAGFVDVSARLDADAPLVAYLDGPGLVDALMPSLLAATDTPDDAETLRRVVAALGLRELGPTAMTAGFDGRSWQTRSFTRLPAERTGLSSLLEVPNLTLDDLGAVPASSVWVAVQSFDVGRLIDVVRATVNAVGTEAAEPFEAALADASGGLGMDVEARLLRGLGTTWTAYLDPDALGESLAGLTLMNPLQDAEGVSRGLRVIGAWATVAAQQALADTPLTLQVQTQTYGDMEVHTLLLPMVAPSWAVADQTLIAGLYPQSVLAARDRLGRDQPLTDRDEVAQLGELIGTRRLTGISWVDLPRTADDAYGGLVGGETLLTGLTAMATGQPMPRVLPPLGRLRPHLRPAYRLAWVDQHGWHTVSHAPFPGSSLLSPQAVGAAATLPLAGSALPAFFGRTAQPAEYPATQGPANPAHSAPPGPPPPLPPVDVELHAPQ